MAGPAQIVDRLRELARNLWWTWQPNVINLFRDLDPVLWRNTDHNPVAFLKKISPEQLERRADELALHSRIDYAFRRLHDYLKNDDSWGATHAASLRSRPVAYFSMEFGLHESLPIYSGGLGVLAGDHLKSASDLGVPLIGVGLAYAQGYFRQSLDADGWQVETYLNARYGYDVGCEVVGENGVAALVEPGRVVTDRSLTRSKPYAADWQPRFAEAYRLELQAWANSLNEGVASPLASAHDGLVANAVADAVISSMHSGGVFVPVRVPLIAE